MPLLRTWLAVFAVVASMMSFVPTVAAHNCCVCGDCDGCACFDNFGLECGYCKPYCRSQLYNWNRNYSHYQYGHPVAMVVPPTANLQSNWGWGVSSFRMSRIDHQFGRNYPGYGAFGGPFRHTPVWPSDTNQFGVYYVRGPW